MKNRFLKTLRLLVVMTSMMLITLTTPLSAKSSSDVVKIVYPLDFTDVKRVHFMLNTLNNLVKHYQSELIDYELSIVAYGPGVQYLLRSDKGAGFKIMPYIHHGGPTGKGTAGRFLGLKQLAGDNLEFFVCRNTMKKKNVTKDMIVPYAKIVPAGVIKLIDLQRDGAAVVKIK